MEPEKKTKDRSFAIDVFKLAGGTIFAQILGALASPIVARLFAPKDFGLAANFTSIVIILSVVASLRYESTIMLPKTKQEAANQFGLTFSIQLIFSVLLIPLLWLTRGWIIDWLNTPDLLPYLWLVPPTVFISGLFHTFNFWNARARQYLRLSIATVTRTVVEFTTKIAAGLMGFANGGMMISANVISQTICSAMLGFQIFKDDKKLFLENIRIKSMLAGAKRYKKFPMYNTWATLLNQVSQQMPTFLLTAYFSTAVTGQYNMGYKILRLPMALIGSSINQVFNERASKARHDGNLSEIVRETSHRLIILGLFPMLVLTITGREVFMFVFGARWADAGIYSQILSIWTFFVLISSPMSSLFAILEKNEYGLLFALVLIATRIGSLVVGGIAGNVILALSLFSATGSLAYFYWLLSLNRLAGIPFKHTLGQFSSSLLKSSPFLLTLAAVKWLTASSPLWVTLTSFLMGAAYYAMLYFIDPGVKEVAAEIFRRAKCFNGKKS